MYQGSTRSPEAPVETTQVILVIDVPPELAEMISRTEELVNEFGRAATRTVPGLRVRKALLVASHSPRPMTASPYARNGLIIDRVNRDVRVDGKPVHLTYREFELLSHLARTPGRALSREDLMRDVWQGRAADSTHSSGRTVDTHVRRLRVKLGRYQRLLTTMRGHGYRFESHPDVRFVGPDDPTRLA